MGSVQEATEIRLTTVGGEPLPSSLSWVASGEVESPLKTPVGVAVPIELPTIGRIYLWSNRNDKGYLAQRSPMVLEKELIQHYQTKVAHMSAKYARKKVPTETVEHYLQQAKQADPTDWRTQLNAVVCAGEALVSTIARTRLHRMGGRSAFLWGIRTETPHLPNLALNGKNPLNLLALPVSTETDWTPLMQLAQRERMVLKGEALLTPALLRQWWRSGAPSEQVLGDYLHQTIGRYRGLIRYWDVASDPQEWMPTPFASLNDLTEFIAQLCEMARTLDFGIVRLIGVTHSFHHRRSGLSVLHRLVDAEVPFEAVHLRVHWYDGDLFSFDYLLEQYGELGKPLYLSLTLPPEEPTGSDFWRTEPDQWFEQACQIMLSKPFVVGATFPAQEQLPHQGGMFHSEGCPSLYWHRLFQMRFP